MSRRVVKIGGSVIRESGDFISAAQLIGSYDPPAVVVLSAVHGVTDLLLRCAEGAGEFETERLCGQLRSRHLEILRECGAAAAETEAARRRVVELTGELRELLGQLSGSDGVSWVAVWERVLSYGERLAAPLLCAVLRGRGRQCEIVTPERVGLIAARVPGGGRVDLARRAPAIRRHLSGARIEIVPGFYGISPDDGSTVLFGRGGSDYSAACLAHCIDAPSLDIYKDVPGFMSADPGLVRDSSVIPHLTYTEAAELAYFGASILHPMSIEPVMKKDIPVRVFSCRGAVPSAASTLIDARIHPSAPPVKSVTFTREMAVLALHGTGLGFQPGILAGATSALSRRGINIKSVLTSQTCISLLLHPDDLNAASLLIEREAIAGVDHIEPENGLALVALVGEGISERCGIVGRTFSAVARCGINVRLVCAGASRAALYFITARRDCERAVGAVHGEFWGDEK